MRRLFPAIGIVCWLTLLTSKHTLATPPEPPETPAIADDDRSSPPRRGGMAAGEAKKIAEVTGKIVSIHQNPEGDPDGLRLDNGTEVRFPAMHHQELKGIAALKNRVTVEGWLQPDESEIHAVTLKNETSGETVDVDRPPPGMQQGNEGPPDRKDHGNGKRPSRRPQEGRLGRGSRANQGERYSIEQAVSDQAQLHTIAFDGLAFLTGDFGSDTFLPPGKVSDYFGFQYMRDIDAGGQGHNTTFLTRIAMNMLAVLNDKQKSQLLALAKEQEEDIRRFAEMRLPLIKAFRRNLEADIPVGSKGLSKNAVVKYSARIYELDGLLAYQRAKVMGRILHGLSSQQKTALAKLKFGDSRTWPDRPEQLDKRSMSHEVNVAMMTYASEMFAWYAGSLEADTYFCPERHGMYFGGFGMKTAPAMGKKNYSISTTLTGDSGEAFLATLTENQRRRITNLLDLQRPDLSEIVKTRRAIATELRHFLKGQSADEDKVVSLSKRYGELDGELSYLYATAFAEIGQTLTVQQKEKLAKMRTSNPSDPKGPFLYSSPIVMPKIENTDFLFGVR